MELIFENVEERDRFFNDHCPHTVEAKDGACSLGCKKCWEQSGVKYKVKEKKQEYDNITITQRLYRIQSLYKSARRLDPDFREDDYVWIIGEALIDHLADIGYEYRSAGDKYKSLAGICITTCHDYPLRVILAKKNLENVGPTPNHPVPIEEQKAHESLYNTWSTLNPGDKLVKCGRGWYVERKQEEPKKVYTTTADVLPNPLVERMLKNMLNVGYGKDGIKPFVVMPRHQGRTAAMYMLDELERTGYFDTDKASTFSVLSKLDHQFYHNKNWKEAIDIFMDKHDRIRKPEIEKVIFNDPATIVFWKDGTKTVVKCQKGDIFDEEKGLAMAICKKVYGEGYWTGAIKEWLPEEEKKKGPSCKECLYSVLTAAEEPCCSCGQYENFTPKEEKKEEPLKTCKNCKYSGNTHNGLCVYCGALSRDYFEPRVDK